MTEIKLNKKEEKELFFKALLGSPFFNIFASVLTTFIVGAVFVKFGGGVPINVTQTSVTKTMSFDVSGRGESVFVPDMATVYFDVRNEGVDVGRLQDEVSSRSKALIGKLLGMGVKSSDITTVSYNVRNDYENKDLFVVTASYKVKVRDLNKLSEIMSLVGSLGLDGFRGPVFGLSDELKEKALRDARKKAIDEARRKAKELAKLSGMKLGKVINVRESLGGGVVPVMKMAESSDRVRGSDVVVSKGSNTVVVDVVMSWEVD